MLRHREHEEPLSQDEYAKLLSEGDKTRGMVLSTEVSETDRSRSRVRIEARFPDHEVAEFGTELSNVYQPQPGSPDAERLTQLRSAEQLRHASRVPKVQLALSAGSMIPLRYNATRRTRIVIDEPALHSAALKDYIEREKRGKTPDVAPRAGPPWLVPAKCPTCGAPVDQAKSSSDTDPHCEFCHEPIPVSPMGPH